MRREARVAFSFNTDEKGGDVAVLVGDALVLDKPPAPTRVKTYLRKYSEGIKDLGMTTAEFTDATPSRFLLRRKPCGGSLTDMQGRRALISRQS